MENQLISIESLQLNIIKIDSKQIEQTDFSLFFFFHLNKAFKV